MKLEPTVLIWEEVSHSYTEAAAEGDVVVGKRKSPKGEYVKRTPTPKRAIVVVTKSTGPRERRTIAYILKTDGRAAKIV
jgi:hypothetical protein